MGWICLYKNVKSVEISIKGAVALTTNKTAPNAKETGRQ